MSYQDQEVKIFKVSKSGPMQVNFAKTFLDIKKETQKTILAHHEKGVLSLSKEALSHYKKEGTIRWWGEKSKQEKGKARYLDQFSSGSEIFFLDPKTQKIYQVTFHQDNCFTGKLGSVLSDILWGSSKWDTVYCFFDVEVINYSPEEFKKVLGWSSPKMITVVASTKGTLFQKEKHKSFFSDETFSGWTQREKSKPPKLLSTEKTSTAYEVHTQQLGWIYLIHPEVYVNQRLAVFKVGKTKEYHHEDRTKTYGEDGILIKIWAVPLDLVDELENTIKRRLRKKKKPHAGSEYFPLRTGYMIKKINEAVEEKLEDWPSYEETMNLKFP